MAGVRRINIPPDYYHQANALKKEYFKQKRIHIPLWRCMIALEAANKNTKDDPFMGLRKP